MDTILYIVLLLVGFLTGLAVYFYWNRVLFMYNDLSFKEKKDFHEEKFELVKKDLIEAGNYNIEYLTEAIEIVKMEISKTLFLFGNKRIDFIHLLDVYTTLKQELEEKNNS